MAGQHQEFIVLGLTHPPVHLVTGDRDPVRLGRVVVPQQCRHPRFPGEPLLQVLAWSARGWEVLQRADSRLRDQHAQRAGVEAQVQVSPPGVLGLPVVSRGDLLPAIADVHRSHPCIRMVHFPCTCLQTSVPGPRRSACSWYTQPAEPGPCSRPTWLGLWAPEWKRLSSRTSPRAGLSRNSGSTWTGKRSLRVWVPASTTSAEPWGGSVSRPGRAEATEVAPVEGPATPAGAPRRYLGEPVGARFGL